MTTRARCKSLRPVAAVVFITGSLGLAWMGSGTAGAVPERFMDPQDTSRHLDLKTIIHTSDERFVTYTIETYASFPNPDADFAWKIDKSGNGTPDLHVATEWDDGLVAAVGNGAGKRITSAAVTRPAPNAIRVSFPVSMLQGATGYRYHVIAPSELKGKGGSGPPDRAPDKGWYEHRLIRAAAPPKATAAPPEPVAGPTAAAPTDAAPAASAAPDDSPAPVRQPAASPAPETPQPAAAPPAASPATEAAAPPAPATDSAPAAAPSSAAPSTPTGASPAALARTGSGTRVFLAVGGLLLALGGVLCTAGKRKVSARPLV